jgi:hypothetical protein
MNRIALEHRHSVRAPYGHVARCSTLQACATGAL